MNCSGVLVVEDDEAIREVVSELLKIEGYPVYSAANGQEALDVLGAIQEPCLILLDLMMPVMDGWQFLEERRKDNVIAKLPVVVVSAIGDRSQPGLSSTSQIVRKPPDVDTLLAIVRKHCGEPRSSTGRLNAAA